MSDEVKLYRSPHPHRQLLGRLKRLVQKELREILRDRRTIITLVVMPILIYPLLAVVFQRFLLTSIAVNEDVVFDIGVEAGDVRLLGDQLQRGAALVSQHEHESSTNSRRDSGKDAPKMEPLPKINLIT